jgi:ABC-type sugar transport system permease subunit
MRSSGSPSPATRFRFRINPGYLFIAPSMLVIAVFVILPILQSFWMSVHDWSFLSPDQPFVGAANYTEALQDPRLWNALKVTFLYTIATVPIGVAISLAVALALNERLPASKWLRGAYFFPAISSLAVMAIVWSFLMDPQIGIVTYWLGHIGITTPDWLRDPAWALPAVAAVGIWKNLGFNMVILLAGLQGIPEVTYEAAAVDGAGRWSRFRHITLPGLRHTVAFVVVISMIASLQVFDQVYVMTRGGPVFSTESLVTYMYHQGFELFRMGYAASLAVILFALIMVVSVIQLVLFRYRDVD